MVNATNCFNKTKAEKVQFEKPRVLRKICVVVGGDGWWWWWVCKPILMFRLSLRQAEGFFGSRSKSFQARGIAAYSSINLIWLACHRSNIPS